MFFKKYVWIFSLFVALFVGCEKNSIPTEQYKVEFLFEQDGCRVYRFADGGYHYFAIYNNGNATTTSSPFSPADHTTHKQEIPTVRSEAKP